MNTAATIEWPRVIPIHTPRLPPSHRGEVKLAQRSGRCCWVPASGKDQEVFRLVLADCGCDACEGRVDNGVRFSRF